MSECHLLDVILDSPWERESLAADIGGLSHDLLSASMAPIAAELISAPLIEINVDEISEAFDDLIIPTTVRVATDLSWSLDA